MTRVAPVLQAFFTDRLMTQRNASPNTIAAYRDTFRLLLRYSATITGKTPDQLDIDDLDAPLIGAFLDHLELERSNSIRTRNNRLAAIHSLFHYAAFRHPEHAHVIQRVIAIPTKRCNRKILTYLTDTETEALLAAPDLTTWTGRRDHAAMLLAVQTGLRISELLGLTNADLALGTGANVKCLGKGRKHRRTPLTTTTVKVLHAWTTERQGEPTEPLFPTRTGHAMSRDAFEHRLKRHLAIAANTCASLRTKNVTAHTLRHTAAMRLLHAGVDITVIALWLGHEHLSTTNIYLHADMTQKERAMNAVTPLGTASRYRPPADILAFLEAL